ncbi:AscBF operon repressor [Klebsiella pneumoniae IS10]|nr:AscBF operon repressor [Klebsiella pneumoniae IS10]
MATMLEVAKRAGVSKATVSRVLSGNGYVSQETKDRVFKAVAESGYRPNLLARNLATKTTQTLGLVVTNTLYHGVYFSELLYHVARMTEDKGRQLILADGKHSAQEEREAIQYLLDLRCDAIIIYRAFSPSMRWTRSLRTTRSRSWCLIAACAATPATASGPIKKPRRCG